MNAPQNKDLTSLMMRGVVARMDASAPLGRESCHAIIKCVIERNPDALSEHHIAFINSLSRVITAAGLHTTEPLNEYRSMRERFAVWSLADQKHQYGQLEIGEVILFAEAACY